MGRDHRTEEARSHFIFFPTADNGVTIPHKTSLMLNLQRTPTNERVFSVRGCVLSNQVVNLTLSTSLGLSLRSLARSLSLSLYFCPSPCLSFPLPSFSRSERERERAPPSFRRHSPSLPLQASSTRRASTIAQPNTKTYTPNPKPQTLHPKTHFSPSLTLTGIIYPEGFYDGSIIFVTESFVSKESFAVRAFSWLKPFKWELWVMVI